MNRKLPPDAFAYYLGLGLDRSYQAVADKYGVCKRAVTSLAVREGWQQQIAKVEREARERTNTKAVETLEAMQDKHLKALQFVLGKAIETLRAEPLETAMEAVRAIEMVIRQERLVRGEPTDRAEIDVAEVVRRESERWLKSPGEVEVGGERAQAS